MSSRVRRHDLAQRAPFWTTVLAGPREHACKNEAVCSRSKRRPLKRAGPSCCCNCKGAHMPHRYWIQCVESTRGQIGTSGFRAHLRVGPLGQVAAPSVSSVTQAGSELFQYRKRLARFHGYRVSQGQEQRPLLFSEMHGGPVRTGFKRSGRFVSSSRTWCAAPASQVMYRRCTDAPASISALRNRTIFRERRQGCTSHLDCASMHPYAVIRTYFSGHNSIHIFDMSRKVVHEH